MTLGDPPHRINYRYLVRLCFREKDTPEVVVLTQGPQGPHTMSLKVCS
jgi:hypothetical protein